MGGLKGARLDALVFPTISEGQGGEWGSNEGNSNQPGSFPLSQIKHNRETKHSPLTSLFFCSPPPLRTIRRVETVRGGQVQKTSPLDLCIRSTQDLDAGLASSNLLHRHYARAAFPPILRAAPLRVLAPSTSLHTLTNHPSPHLRRKLVYLAPSFGSASLPRQPNAVRLPAPAPPSQKKTARGEKGGGRGRERKRSRRRGFFPWPICRLWLVQSDRHAWARRWPGFIACRERQRAASVA